MFMKPSRGPEVRGLSRIPGSSSHSQETYRLQPEANMFPGARRHVPCPQASLTISVSKDRRWNRPKQFGHSRTSNTPHVHL
jgi:hypothetical protein